MKNIAILLLPIALSIQTISGQTNLYQSAISVGGTLDDSPWEMTRDVSGNILVTGYFNGTADFDPGPGFANLTSAGQRDNYILKLTSAGNLLWAKKIGGTSGDDGLSISTDQLGNIYRTGYFVGTSDLDPGPASLNIISNGNNDIFIQKLDPMGNLLWNAAIGGTLVDWGKAIRVAPSGYVYITGHFQSSVDFDPGISTTNLTSAGGSDAYIMKMSPAGSLVWVKQIAGTGLESGSNIEFDADENIYVTGNFSGTSDFDPGAGTFNVTAAGLNDIFILKMDSFGNFLWVKTMGGTMNDYTTGVSLDNIKSIYTTGYFWGTADFDPGPGVFNLITPGSNSNIFISKIDSSGNFCWAKRVGTGSASISYSIALDDSANVYSTGTFGFSPDFDPGPGISQLHSNGGADIFVLKLDSSGNYRYAFNIGGSGSDYGYEILVDSNYMLTIAGAYQNTVDFNLDSLGTDTLVSNGGEETFVSVYDQCFSPLTTINATTCNTFVSPSGNYIWNSNGTYYDTIPNAAICGDSLFMINLSIVPLNTSVIISDTLLTSTALASSYQWIDCDLNSAPIAGATSQSYMPTSTSGNYAVIISDNGCIDTSACYSLATNDLNQFENYSFLIHPNPVNSFVNVQYNGDENIRVELIDMTGKKIGSYLLQPGNNPIDVSDLANGVYSLGVNGKYEKILIAH